MEYVRFNKEKKIHLYKYTFSPSGLKDGLMCPFTEDVLERFIRTNETLKITAESEKINRGPVALKPEDFI